MQIMRKSAHFSPLLWDAKVLLYNNTGSSIASSAAIFVILDDGDAQRIGIGDGASASSLTLTRAQGGRQARMPT